MRARSLLARTLAVGLLALASLTGCGDDEPMQRKAFIEFLQTRIVNKPGLHVPHLTFDEEKAFGEYAKHYAIIADFNDSLDAAVSKPMSRTMEAAVPRSLAEAVQRRGEFAALGDSLVTIRAALDARLAAADAAHAALKQPPDLKPVFDAAYDRDVTQPAKLFVDMFPDADAAMKAILALTDFIAQHPAIRVQGSMLQTSDPALQAPLQSLLDAVRAKNDAINDARRRFNSLING